MRIDFGLRPIPLFKNVNHEYQSLINQPCPAATSAAGVNAGGRKRPDQESLHCGGSDDFLLLDGKEKKIVSYCASGKQATESYLDYRFGAAGKVELSHRASGTDTSGHFKRADVLAANNASTVIWFSRGPFSYVLNDPVRGEPFLEVKRKGGQKLAMFKCESTSRRDTSIRNSYVADAAPEEFFGIDE